MVWTHIISFYGIRDDLARIVGQRWMDNSDVEPIEMGNNSFIIHLKVVQGKFEPSLHKK